MIVVDIESTGLNPDEHSLISIGAVDFNEPERQFFEECRIWNGADCDANSLEVTGSTVENVSDPERQSEGELVQHFLSWAYGSPEYTIAGQNVHFDLSFIHAAASRAGEGAAFGHRVVDLHSICFAQMIQRGEVPPSENGTTALNSGTIMRYVGIPEEPRPHVAINGARWEAEAFSRLLHGKALLDKFKRYPVSWLEE